MVAFTKLGAEIFRDFVTSGVPSSGAHKPIKSDIRAWMASVEAECGETVSTIKKYSAGLWAYKGNDAGVVIGNSAGLYDTTDSVNIGFFAGCGGTTAITGTSQTITNTGAQTIRIGRHAGSFTKASGNGVIIGHAAGQYAFDGGAGGSVLIGYETARNVGGSPLFYHFSSVILGPGAVKATTKRATVSAQSAVVIGANAGLDPVSVASAVVIGASAGAAAGLNAQSGVIIGSEAGQTTTAAVGAVLLGYQAGKSLVTANYRLVIDGHPSSAPAGNTALIYGEFDNRILAFNTTEIRTTGYITIDELGADPAAPAANKARVFVRDDGAGHTQLCVRYATGAVEVINTQPS